MIDVVVAEAAEIEVGERLARVAAARSRRHSGARSTSAPIGSAKPAIVGAVHLGEQRRSADGMRRSRTTSADQRVPFLLVDVAERRADVRVGQVAAERQQPVDPHRDVLVLGQLIEISGDAPSSFSVRRRGSSKSRRLV